MGAFNDYIVSGKYKLWRITNNSGVAVQIGPRAGDKVEPALIIVVDVFLLDPQYPGGRIDKYWYIYLYDFVKYGRTIKKKQTIVKGGRDISMVNPYYEPGIEERLGGTKERLGD